MIAYHGGVRVGVGTEIAERHQRFAAGVFEHHTPAGRVVADTTRDGGFPPLLLDPIDFMTLYRAQMAQAQKGQVPQATTA